VPHKLSNIFNLTLPFILDIITPLILSINFSMNQKSAKIFNRTATSIAKAMTALPLQKLGQLVVFYFFPKSLLKWRKGGPKYLSIRWGTGSPGIQWRGLNVPYILYVAITVSCSSTLCLYNIRSGFVYVSNRSCVCPLHSDTYLVMIRGITLVIFDSHWR